MLATRVYSRPRCRTGKDGILIDERVGSEHSFSSDSPRPRKKPNLFFGRDLPRCGPEHGRELRHVIFRAQGGSCKPFRCAWNLGWANWRHGHDGRAASVTEQPSAPASGIWVELLTS